VALLTIFSAPKPFTNPHINTIQRNAIQSWLHLGAEVEVLLIGEETGLAEAASEYGVRVLSDVERNEAGTPLVSSIFRLARQNSSSLYLAYVNADILLTHDIVWATQEIGEILKTKSRLNALDALPFLLIGQRWDLEVLQILDFSDGWEERLRADLKTDGQLHLPAGSDYFVFPRSIYTNIPNFAIGRAGWDNWMIFEARRQSWPVIDGTPSVLVVHQDHDYSHLPGGKPHYDLEESHENMSLAGGFAHMYMVLDAQKQLVADARQPGGRLKRPQLTQARLLRTIERWLTPKEGGLRGRRGALARRFRRMRRRLTD
jgi:hypothetical protein